MIEILLACIIFIIGLLLYEVYKHMRMEKNLRKLKERMLETKDAIAELREQRPRQSVYISSSDSASYAESYGNKRAHIDLNEDYLQDSTDETMTEEQHDYENAPTERRCEILKQFVKNLLRDLNMQPEDIEGRDEFQVAFQGEMFIIRISEHFVTVIDPNWLSMEKDSSKLNLVRTALNFANIHTVYAGNLSVPDEEGILYVSSNYTFPFYPAFKEAKDFLKFVLLGAFDYKKVFQTIYQDLDKNGNPSLTDLTMTVGGLTSPTLN